MKNTLLVLDDNNLISGLLEKGLSDDSHVLITSDPEITYRVVGKRPPDVLLINANLKEDSAVSACKVIRTSLLAKKIPILIYNGQPNSEQLLKAYESGADDYIDTPLDLSALKIRIKARIARLQAIVGQELKFENLVIAPDQFEVRINNNVIKLSHTEYSLLQVFLKNPYRNITRKEILNTIWKNAEVEARTIDVHVSVLRKKLKDFDYKIQAIYGGGYMLRPKKIPA